jgi:hypothetical protein
MGTYLKGWGMRSTHPGVVAQTYRSIDRLLKSVLEPVILSTCRPGKMDRAMAVQGCIPSWAHEPDPAYLIVGICIVRGAGANRGIASWNVDKLLG